MGPYCCYRKPDICRVLKALPRAIYRALGKVTICRVPTERHSATKRHSAKICFAECLFTDTRQTCLCRVPRGQHSAHSLTCTRTLAAPVACHGRYCLPSARKGTLGKHLFAECHATGTRQRLSRHAAVTIATNVTVIVCRVPGWGTRQRFINAECNYNGTRHSDSLPSVRFSSRRNNKKNFPNTVQTFSLATILYKTLHIRIWYIFCYVYYI